MKKDWIKRLPPGEYTMKQIKEFANISSRASAKLILIKYGAIVIQVPTENSNFFKDVFIWKGFKGKNDSKK